MKIGMIFECGPQGADKKVYEYLAKQLRSDISIISNTLDNKPKLIELCGDVAKALLEIEGCEKVIILWDLYPPWRRPGESPCVVEDCNLIRDTLNNANLTAQQLQCVHLVCIKQELETLLLADERAIAVYLRDIKGRSCRVNGLQHPEHHVNPKARLSQIFHSHIGRKYEDMRDAERIIRLANIDKIRRCSSFVRFADKVRT